MRASHWPSRTPTRLEQIRAKAAPTKTSHGEPDCADSSSVASWVLSPSSAMNTVPKVLAITAVNPVLSAPLLSVVDAFKLRCCVARG